MFSAVVGFVIGWAVSDYLPTPLSVWEKIRNWLDSK